MLYFWNVYKIISAIADIGGCMVWVSNLANASICAGSQNENEITQKF